MDDVARLPIADRTDLFVATARRRALTVRRPPTPPATNPG